MSNNRITIFEGIRGWASVIVLLSHILCFLPIFGYIDTTPIPIRLLVDGTFAVYIFFVLSGIVLSIGYFKKNELSYLYLIAIKRCFRLGIPIFISCGIVAILMNNNLLFNLQAKITQDNGWLGLFYDFDSSFRSFFKFVFFDVFFTPDYKISYNAPLWTIREEVTGTFLTVFLLLCIHFINFKIIFMLIAAIICYNTNLNKFCFSSGILLAYLYIKYNKYIYKIRNIYFNILFVFLFFIVYSSNNQHMKYSLGSILFIITIFSIKKLYKLFSLNFSKFLGKISFSLYIVHMPIICSFSSFIIVRFGYNISISLITAILTFFVSIIIAYLFHPIDKISIQISNKISYFLREREREREREFLTI